VRVNDRKISPEAGDISHMGRSKADSNRECCCRECLEETLGTESYAACVQAALDAPPPSPAVVERVRQWAAPAVAQIQAKMAAGTYEHPRCPRPNCECGNGPGQPGPSTGDASAPLDGAS